MDDNDKIIIGKKEFTRKQIMSYRKIYIILGFVFIVIGAFSIPFIWLFSVLFFALAHSYKKSLEQSKNDVVVSDPDVAATVFDNPTPESSVVPKAVSAVKTETHKVAGTSFRIDAIMSMAFENDDFEMSKREIIDEDMIDEKIFKYDFDPIRTELIEEPTNEYDSNAIKVVIDGVHVGYIKKGSCSHVKKLLHSGIVLKITSEFFGGDYKTVYEDEDDDGNDIYSIESGHYDIGIKITITY